MCTISKADFHIPWSADFASDTFSTALSSECFPKFRWCLRCESVNPALFSRVFPINLLSLSFIFFHLLLSRGSWAPPHVENAFVICFAASSLLSQKQIFLNVPLKLTSVKAFFMEGTVPMGRSLMKTGKAFFPVKNECLRCLWKIYALSNEWIPIASVNSLTLNILDGDE